MDADGLVIGTYLHGLFANHALRRALLTALARRRGRAPDPRWGSASPGGQRYDRLADEVSRALDLAVIARLAGLEPMRA
jgi:adenosylcobyric acid synthase